MTRDELATKYLEQLPYPPYPVQEEALLAWFTSDQGVLVCAPTIRPALRRLVALGLPRLPVLSYAEVTGAGVTVETTQVVNGGHAIAA